MSSEKEDATNGILVADAPTVDSIPESDPEGKVPAEILINGGTARVPRWPDYADQPGKIDNLKVFWQRNGTDTTIYDQNKPGPITENEFLIPLAAALFAEDGIAYLHYRAQAVPGNPLRSRLKKLTIDHSVAPLPVLLEPIFPDSDRYGYLHCSTVRPIWEGVYIKVPYQGFQQGDVCECVWRGFSNVYGDEPGYVEGTRLEFQYILSRTDADNREGFELTPIPFISHLEPLIKECSGTAIYKIRRGGRYIGQSLTGLVKIDRIPAGGTEPCGPV